MGTGASAEVRNAWISTSTPPYIFMALVKLRDNFTFNLGSVLRGKNWETVQSASGFDPRWFWVFTAAVQIYFVLVFPSEWNVLYSTEEGPFSIAFICWIVSDVTVHLKTRFKIDKYRHWMKGLVESSFLRHHYRFIEQQWKYVLLLANSYRLAEISRNPR
jgi:hypothetical protein